MTDRTGNDDCTPCNKLPVGVGVLGSDSSPKGKSDERNVVTMAMMIIVVARSNMRCRTTRFAAILSTLFMLYSV